jgi:hypothetical protein
MRRLIFFISCFLLISVQSGVFAQKVKSFSEEEDKYLKDLKDLLESGDKSNGKKIFDEFAAKWISGNFSYDEKIKIIANSNALLKKRGQAFPHFAGYIGALTAWSNYSGNLDNQAIWEDALHYMLEKRTFQLAKLNEFFDHTILLINRNTLFSSASTTWKTDSYSYTFTFNDDKFAVRFDTTDLVCYAKEDSIRIMNTSGIYYPLEETWSGSGGLVSWERVGFSSDSVYAGLSEYSIDTRRSSYEANNVTFFHKGYSKEPMIGVLRDKIVADVTESRISYPRFESYQDRLSIRNIYPGIDYEGSFSMHGNKFLSSGKEKSDAYLTFYRDGKPFLICASPRFVFQTDQVLSGTTSITFKLEKDSIYHPGITFRYTIADRLVTLTRSGEGMSRAPFYNSYHMVDMDFEQMIWNIDDPKVSFNMVKGGESRAGVFESVNYFSAERYWGLQGLDKNHPYTGLARYYSKYKTRVFTATEYAAFIGMSATQVRQQLMQLSYLGIISYDVEQEVVTLRDRLFYYLQAVAGKTDYDVIAFVSNPGAITNASLNLLTSDLKIYGVPSIQLSDSQNVVIFPVNGEVLLKKNRDFEFDGKVSAGKFDFYGKKFAFSYDNFKIKLDNIDSLRIWVTVRDKAGDMVMVRLRTVIEDITGDLQIDHPENKSGKEQLSKYPVFNSFDYSYVYYNKPSIQSGVYKRENFYFQINPYSIDSLDEFSTQSLRFEGNFTSAGIFPSFDETLNVQPDFSLGFYRQTPAGGFPAYGGKGTYKNTIQLSHKGLRGDGILDYLTTTITSNDFLFFPDSTNAIAQTFDTRKQMSGIEFPVVNTQNALIHWLPKEDKLLAVSKEIPFNMYGESTLKGTLSVEPRGLSGGGFMEFQRAQMTADLFEYKANTFTSDSARFDLLTSEEDGFAFRTDNVKAFVDFPARKGRFELNDKEEFIDIPPCQYICSMDLFTWYMDKEEIDLSVSWLTEKDKTTPVNSDPFALADSDQNGSLFISTHPLQDSLQFVASMANYKIRESLITAHNVRTIDVADAAILPGDGMVQIEKKAIMRTLEEAKIVANRDSKFHLLYNASVNIFSRKNYNASATYDYTDELNRKQKIRFEVVAVTDSLTTFATGEIPDTAGFMLSPHFVYQGEVRLNAPREYLLFNGSARMNYNCERINNNWLAFNSEINPSEVYIPVSANPLDFEKNKLAAGILMKLDSTHVYTSFLNKPKKYSDITLLGAAGWLTFDNQSREYVIGSREKIDNPDEPENMLRLSKEKCQVTGEGKIDPGIYAGQVKIHTAGFAEHDLITDTVDLRLMMILDFYFPVEVLEMMAKAIYGSSDLEPADLTEETFTRGLPILIGKEKSAEAMRNLSMYGEYRRMPSELEKSLVLTNVSLYWDNTNNSWLSYGPITIGNIGKTEINRIVEGKLEFMRTRTNNEFTLYISVDYNKWYYFEYKRNNLFVVSSDDLFNIALKEMKADRRSNKIKGEPPLTIVPANERKKSYFLKRFNIDEDPPEDEE